MMMIDHIGKNREIVVSVLCITYNHRPYIEQTIDSFLGQRTNFPFEILIHDDASTDGTAEIIREYADRYPDKIRVVLQEENQYSKGVCIPEVFLYPLANGAYLAGCEGDDYWPDADKLQKQYDFLQSHPQYSAVAGVTHYFNDEGAVTSPPMPSKDFAGKDADEWNFLHISDANIGTNTLMYRSEYMQEPNWNRAREESPFVGDILVMLWLFEAGKIYIFEDVFQNHRHQTRKDASNYNSIFGLKQKLSHNIQVFRAVCRYFAKPHDLRRYLGGRIAEYFRYCVKRGKVRELFALRRIMQTIDPEYRKSILSAAAKELASYLRGKII